MANEYFKKEIAELEAKGITLDELTGDEVAELVRACDNMHNPFKGANCELAGFPFILPDGNVLYRLTIGATVWLDEFAATWWKTGDKRYFWAMVYALGNARDKDAFHGLTDEKTARQRIVEYSTNFAVTEDELLEAIHELIPNHGEGKVPTVMTDTDWGEIVRSLVVATGIDNDIWVWGRATDWVARAYNKHASYIAAVQGKRVDRMKDELDHATNRIARIRFAIINRLEGAGK